MARKHKKLSPKLRASEGSPRTMKITARITRQASYRTSTGGYAFQACIRGVRGSRFVCGYGKNPRKALAAALSGVAKRLGKRSGSFEGMR